MKMELSAEDRALIAKACISHSADLTWAANDAGMILPPKKQMEVKRLRELAAMLEADPEPATSAAPDLLAALKLARGYVEACWGLTNDDPNSQAYKDMATIDATIAKAEGRF